MYSFETVADFFEIDRGIYKFFICVLSRVYRRVREYNEGPTVFYDHFCAKHSCEPEAEESDAFGGHNPISFDIEKYRRFETKAFSRFPPLVLRVCLLSFVFSRRSNDFDPGLNIERRRTRIPPADGSKVTCRY